MTKILIIEDNKQLRDILKRELEKYDYSPFITDNFKEIFSEIDSIQPDLILLDINLPYYDGFYLCKSIRKKYATPIIIISSRDSTMDQVMGLELGADDYITKPFSLELLLTKVKVVLRRGGMLFESKDCPTKKDTLLKLDHDNLSLNIKDSHIDLTKNEFNILSMLNSNGDRITRREELLSALWDTDIFVDDNTLTVNISRVKNKLRKAGLSDIIITKRGVGYKLDSNKLSLIEGVSHEK